MAVFTPSLANHSPHPVVRRGEVGSHSQAAAREAVVDDKELIAGARAGINALFRNGDRAAIDLLIRIARTETDLNVRRSLISRLGRTEDARVKELLKDLVG